MSTLSGLQPAKKLLKNRKFVLNIVLDGVAISPKNKQNYPGDAFYHAHTPVFDAIKDKYLYRQIFAHGTYVGLATNEDMGNSEVGHNALGAGKIYNQGAKLVNQAINDGSLYQGQVWKSLLENCQKHDSALHFIGLLSDGNVHSHIEHLKSMIAKAKTSQIKRIYIHALLDGRDVAPTSAPIYVKDLEDFIAKFNHGQEECKIATVGGRMKIVMDRYEADWQMVAEGWKLIVEGKGRQFASALEGIETLRRETAEGDQYLPPFVVARSGKPVATVEDNDSVVLFNFRGDRAIEISQAFENQDLAKIKREKKITVYYAGMMQYDGDLQLPSHYLVSPPSISHTMGEYLVQSGVPLFAVSETQKYGHVTFFWNGNRSSKFAESLEKYVEIPSDNVPFEQRPWMKAAEITDATIELLHSGKYRFGRINYPNGDMVGHSGDFNAARLSIEATDLSLGRLLKVVKELGGIAIVTADHGNCDEMYQLKKGVVQKDQKGNPIPKTSHTLNPVPLIIYDPQYNGEYTWREGKEFGLTNIAATTFNLLGFEKPADYNESLIQFS